MIKSLNMSEKEKTTLLIGLFVVLVVTFYFYVFVPTEKAIAEIEKDLTEVQTKLDEVQAIEDDLAGFEAHLLANKSEIEAIEAKLPSGGNRANFIRIVEEKAKVSKLKAIALEAEDPIEQEQYMTYPYKVSVRGGYSDIISFCKSIESIERLADIKGWKLAKDPDLTANVTAELHVEIYGGKGKNPLAEKKLEIPEQNRNPFWPIVGLK